MRIARLFLLVLVLSASWSILAAQTAPAAAGTPAFGTYTSGPDVINVGNLNMHLTIPILNKQGRAGMNFVYNLTYDNSIWQQVGFTGSLSWQPVGNWGWGGVDQPSYVTYAMTTSSGSCGQYGQYSWQSWTYTNLTYVDSTGGTHPTNFQGSYVNSPSGSSYCPPSSSNPPPNLPVATSDNSGYTIYPTVSAGSLSAYVTDKYAKTYDTPAYANGGSGASQASYSATDANGNDISGANGVYTDTTGMTALTVTGASPNPMSFGFKNPSGGTSNVTVNYGAPVTIRTNFGCSGVHEYQATNQYLVSSIVLPDNSEYQFTYEQTPGYPGDYTGRVASIQLPTGGTITYQYTNASDPGGISCTDDGNTYIQRTLSANSGSLASTVTYARAASGGRLPSGLGCSAPSCTEVVDGYGNYSEYNFIPPYIPTTGPAGPLGQYYETSRKVYQGAASGTPKLARATCYNGATNCSATSLTFPVSSVDTFNTLDGSETDGATAAYDTNGNLTGQTTYDFGSGSSRGAQLRRETWNYGFGGIPGLRTLDTVYDGGSNIVAKTEFDYDQGTPTTSSGVPQHTSVSGTRGNLTEEKFYMTSGTYLTNYFTYEDTGSVLSSTDPSGATTTYSYDSTFVYNKIVNDPTPSSGIALSTSQSYDTSYSGLPKISTDMNNQQTNIASYDPSLRPTEVDYPDGGKTTFTYSPTSVAANVYQTSSTYSTTETELDGYGRQSGVFTAKDQSGNWYERDYCYDTDGNLGFVSYTYQTSSPGGSKVCSGTGDTYSYDPIGRITQIAHSDGTKQQYSYLGRATETQDENGVTRISQIDGMGRPSIVCEISNGSGVVNSGSPSSCGTDIAGTGFTTNYSYNLASGTTTVTQGVQTRTFQTDWLGRTISVTEPERGTTTYSYAYNSTGLQVTRVRPRANQTGSLTTTTTTQYDVLGRPISVSYSDGTTPAKTYAYDANPGWSVSATNLKGRLALASSGSGSTATGDLFSYDAMGRILQMWGCAPSTCGTSNQTGRSVNYNYDYAGNVTLESDGAMGAIAYTRSLAGEVTSIVNESYSLTGGAGPTTLVSNIQNGPNGPTSFTLANGLNTIESYDSLGRINGTWLCSNSTSPSCSGGTQLYGFISNWKGLQLQNATDSALGQTSNYGYDEFNRLTSRTVTSGTPQNFTYVYDRWGNRWQQNVTAGSGPAPQLSFNTSTNQITSAGFAYDAAGNMTNDGSRSYTYDAEGNVTAVDGGGTATAVYDALNHKVHAQTSGGTVEYLFDASGRVTSNWISPTFANEGHIFWDGTQIAYRAQNALTYFIQTDWVETDRVHSDPNGTANGTYTSLPYGDGGSATSQDGYSGWDFNHFGDIDYNSESNTYHATFRQYSQTDGRWMSPDPYDGSYDFGNPQSFNRYAYVLNSPLAYLDPTGLLHCIKYVTCPMGNVSNDGVDVGEFADIPLVAYSYDFVAFPGQSWSGEVDGQPYTGTAGQMEWVGSQIGTSLDFTSASLFEYIPLASTGTIAPLSRAACASMVADREYSIAAHTSGSSPDNPIVEALLGNSVSGLYNLWNAPSISSGLEQLVAGGYNPGIPGGIAIDGGLAGVYTNGAIKAAATNLGEAAGETAASVIGATKFAYDLGAWGYAYVARCK